MFISTTGLLESNFLFVTDLREFLHSGRIDFISTQVQRIYRMRGKSGHLFRDRTQEFLTIVERLKRSVILPNDLLTNGSKFKEKGSKPSEFNKKASGIGVGIHQTSQKLAKLALCKLLDSLFDYEWLEIRICSQSPIRLCHFIDRCPFFPVCVQ